MERHLSIPIGIVIERRAVESAWQTYVWRPTEAVIGETSLEPGSRIRCAGDTEAYFAGTASLDLHPTDVVSYQENLRQSVPRIYVVLAPEDERPPRVHLVTAAPDEAQSYLDGDPRLVDGVPMPASLIALISAYIEEYAAPAATGEIGGRRFRRARGDEQPETAR